MNGEGRPSVAAAVVAGQLRRLQQQLAGFAAVLLCTLLEAWRNSVHPI